MDATKVQQEFLKPGIPVTFMFIDIYRFSYFITERARLGLGEDLRQFMLDSSQVIGCHWDTITERLLEENIPREEWPTRTETMGSNGFAFVKDCALSLYLIAHENELVFRYTRNVTLGIRCEEAGE